MEMDYETYKTANIQALLVANAIEALPLKEMRESQEHAHALGPIVDPTIYRNKLEELQIDCDRTRILLKAQGELKALRAQYEDRHAR
jgi:hypothetical protein